MISKKAMLEGVLFASTQPVKMQTLSQVLEMEADEIKEMIGELQESYASEDRGFWLVMISGAYQLRTKPELKEIMAKFHAKKPPRLSQAMLEVLSIVAYKQPATRPEIDKIRGVDSSGALKTLLERELIEMRGRSSGPGNPVLYATTPKFLEWFQVSSLGELPPLSEIDALNIQSDDEVQDLMNTLNRDGGFTQEDLRGLDKTLHEIAKEQRKVEVEIDPKKSESENQAEEPGQITERLQTADQASAASEAESTSEAQA